MSKRNCCNCNNNMLCCGHNSSNKVTAEGENYHCVNNRLCARINSSENSCRYSQTYFTIQNDPHFINYGDRLIDWDSHNFTLISQDFESQTFYSADAYQALLRITSREHTTLLEALEHIESSRFIFCYVTSDTAINDKFPTTGFPFTYSDFGFGKNVGSDFTVDDSFFSSLMPMRIKTTLNSITSGQYDKTIEFESYNFGFNLVISSDGRVAQLDKFANCYDGDNLRKPVLGNPVLYSIMQENSSVPTFTFKGKQSYFSTFEQNHVLPMTHSKTLDGFLTSRIYDTNKSGCTKPGIIDLYPSQTPTENDDVELNGWGIDSPFDSTSLKVFCPYNSTSCSNYLSFYNLQEKKTCMDLMLYGETSAGNFSPVSLNTIANSTNLIDSQITIIPSGYTDRDYVDEVDLRNTTLLYRESGPPDLFGNPTLVYTEVYNYNLPVAVPFTSGIASTDMSILDASRTKYVQSLNSHSATCSCQSMKSQTIISQFLEASFNKIVANNSINSIPENIIMDSEAYVALNYNLSLDGVAEKKRQYCNIEDLLEPDDCTGVEINGTYFDKIYYISFLSSTNEVSQTFEKVIYVDGIWSSISLVSLDYFGITGAPNIHSGPSDPVDSLPCFNIDNYNYLCTVSMAINGNNLVFSWSSVHGSQSIIKENINCYDLRFGWLLNGEFPFQEFGYDSSGTFFTRTVMLQGSFMITPKYIRYE